ncbi:acylphosphatase [Sporolactobacillus sp. THM7-4]|nr:acylphosphatase [Sporolactobacillus sp. THM7-4]
MNDTEKMKSAHLIVQGRVQAVGFRYFAWQSAKSLRVNGWVRNRMDGSVEIVAEGPEERVNHFIQVIKKGNRFSRVENMDVRQNETLEHFKTFEIRY